MYSLSDEVERKFTEVYDASDWLVMTDTGWQPVIDVKQTVPYTVWELTLDNGQTLKCADDHIVFHENYDEVFVKDLIPGDTVLTESGTCRVVSVEDLGYSDHMYDIGVDSVDHRYYSSGILSHNTTCAVGYLLWYGMFIPNQTILIAAHVYTMALEIMQRVRYAYEMCPDFIRPGVTNYNKGSIEFENGSRIISSTTTENTGRGMSISLLFLDELSSVPITIAAELWSSISPTLATGGKCIVTSTPNSTEDLFHQIWSEANEKFDEYGNETELGKNGFFPFRADWWEHPDRDEAWKAGEMAKIGEAMFRREYNNEFVTFEETLISPLLLADMKGIEPQFKQGEVRWYQKPKDDKLYVIGLDPSLGTGGNYSAIQVLEMPSMIQVAEWHHNLTPVEGQIKVLRSICRYILESCPKSGGSNIFWSVENNNVGEAALVVIKNIGEESIPGLFVSEPARKGHVRKFRKGFNTTHRNKISACSKLKHFIESGKMTVMSRNLVSELKSYIAKGPSFEAKVGAQDDLVAAMLLLIRMSTIIADWDSSVYATMSGQHAEDVDDHYELPLPIFISVG